MRKDYNNVHVVMLPWAAAFGHLIPFFNLAITLAQVGGIHVSFVSTPRNIKRLPKVLPNLTHLVKLVEFPMPILDDNTLLPEDAEASVDVPPEKIQSLKAAYDLLQQPIKHFIADEKPDWIIADFAQHWIIDIAETYEIPIIYICIFGAASTGFSIGATALGEAPEILTSPVFQMLDFPSNLFGLSKVRVIRAYVDMLRRRCLGAFLNGWINRSRGQSYSLDLELNLNRVKSKSIYEIAYRLELYGLQFIWILQKPREVAFRQRTTEKGVVHIGWAPQQEILRHPSIGGLGIEVERNEEDGSFTRNEIEKALRYAMVSEEGEELRVRAKEAAAIFGDQNLHDSYVASLVEYLKNK
ncbi:hypothetical protein T459_21841 [Capsicum annuum]|uniref:UDP-rhamnose:rhamnosyltransferase 1 n=1 Tax=Capsicum annuum TaxID=4072 RepID=A0A2G2YXU1_CAPAN|nr:hypothetical protein T459_21841 [Capsicum annuum]